MSASSCRDKGRMWRGVGALCLSSSQHDSSGFREVRQKNHAVTRTSTRPPHPPCPTPCPYRTPGTQASRWHKAPIRSSQFIRTRPHSITGFSCECSSGRNYVITLFSCQKSSGYSLFLSNSWRAMTNFWISLVPSATSIKGASR